MHDAAALIETEKKFATCEFKRIASNGAFEGYASLFGVEDLGHDIVEPGAFRHCLATKNISDIKLLFQHDPSEPIGVWEHIAEDAHGLHVRGRLLPSVARAREVHDLMKAGAVNGLSIGFKTIHGARDRTTGVRRLSKIDLWEISIVTFPMQPDARVSQVKTFGKRGVAGPLPTLRDIERTLTQDAGLSRTQARALLRSGYPGLCPNRARKQDAARDLTPHMIADRMRRAASDLRAST